MFRLVLRFYDPDAGAIRLDGVDLRDADPQEVRARMALVSQDAPVTVPDAPTASIQPFFL